MLHSSTISQEEDIAHSTSESSQEQISNTQLNKEKGKKRQIYTENPDSSILRTSSEALDAASYPPINDDAEDTRRVEENLRRWEIAERQRRKAAREPSQNSAYVSSASRASLLWLGRKSRVPSINGLGGAHTALQSQDNVDTVPLRGINISPTPSTSRSDSEDSHLADPFSNPPDSVSPFSDAHQLEQFEAMPVPYKNRTPTLAAVEFHNNPPKARHPPPPKPLSLPLPRTPPPIANFSPITPSDPTFGDGNIPQNTRWWHEWLCGCGEGPDRGGDNQAGRTNPFE